jgi:hypothetical protein
MGVQGVIAKNDVEQEKVVNALAAIPPLILCCSIQHASQNSACYIMLNDQRSSE